MAQVPLKRLNIIFIFATISLLALSYLCYLKIQTLIDESKVIFHSHHVKLELEKILSSINALESRQRSFLITKDSSLLEVFDTNIDILYVHLNTVDSLTRDNPAINQKTIALKSAIDTRIETLKSNILLSPNSSLTSENFNKGKIQMDFVRLQISNIKLEEDKLLRTRSSLFRKSAYNTPVFIVLLIIGSFVIIIVAYFRIAEELKEVDRLNKAINQRENALMLSEDRFRKFFDYTPIPLTLSSIKSNKIVYANKSFYTTFGYEEKEIIGQSSEELNLVGPEEAERIVKLLLDVLQETRTLDELKSLPEDETTRLLIKLQQTNSLKNLALHFTRKNGEIFPAEVSFEIIEFGLQSFTITSYQDITERIKAKELLQKQNEELQKKNKELESFNYISSHDLQEPLRQIQNFASRILDTEATILSDKGKIYFEKLNNAANRMQILISDLLSYSQTTTSERKFTQTDLNTIVKQVQSELKEMIVAKNAIIEVGEMCAAHIIPFQFSQLLHNLIGNAIKFSKPDTPPIIKIKSQIITSNQVQNANLIPEKEYCHLSICDNGIGFEPQYKDRIFEIFQRLHDKQKIAGTGIGLAIVKKIVEMHGGFVTATSELNEGATFDVYFPTPQMN